MIRDGRLQPDSFVNPSLPLYLMGPPLWIQDRAARAGLLSGHAADPLLLGRVLAGLAGAGAVFILGVAVRRTHPRLGTLPPLFLALMPGFVNLCHFATPEAWLLLATSATLALSLAHLQGRAPAWALGLALGLAASTKYTAAALLLPALAAVWLRPARQASPYGRVVFATGGLVLSLAGLSLVLGLDALVASRLHLNDPRLLHPESASSFVRGIGWTALMGGAVFVLLALLAGRPLAWARGLARPQAFTLGLTALAGFLAGTPFAALDPGAFLSGLAFNYQTQSEYKGLAAGSATSYGAYLGLLADALTGPLLVAVGVGVLVATGRALRRERSPIVLLMAALAPYLLVAGSGHQAMRFLAPVFPAAAWLAGMGLAAVPSPGARRIASILVTARAGLAALLVVRLFFVDSRRRAGEWMEAYVPAGASVDLITNHSGYVPAVPPGRSARIVPTLSREMAPPERFAEAAARYRDEGAPWLVLTASYYERFLQHPDQRPERAAFFSDLLGGSGGYEVAARFRQQGWLRPKAEFLDPEIVILQRLRGPAPPPPQ